MHTGWPYYTYDPYPTLETPTTNNPFEIDFANYPPGGTSNPYGTAHIYSPAMQSDSDANAYIGRTKAPRLKTDTTSLTGGGSYVGGVLQPLPVIPVAPVDTLTSGSA